MSSLKPPVSTNINRTARRKKVDYSALYENGKPPENSLNGSLRGSISSISSNTASPMNSRSSIINKNSSNYLFGNNANNNSSSSINSNISNSYNNNNDNINNNSINKISSLNKSSSLLKYANEPSKSVSSKISGFNTYSSRSSNSNKYGYVNSNPYQNYYNSSQISNLNQTNDLQKINKDLMNELNEVKDQLIKCQNEIKKLKELNSKIEEKLIEMNSNENIPKSFGNISKSLEEVIRKKNLLEQQLKDNGIEPVTYSEKQTPAPTEKDNSTSEESTTSPVNNPPKDTKKEEKPSNNDSEESKNDDMSLIDAQRKKFEDECLSFTKFMSEKDDIVNKLMSEIENKTSIFTNLVNKAKNGEIGQSQGQDQNNNNNNDQQVSGTEGTTENPAMSASLQKLNEQPRPEDGSMEAIVNDVSNQQEEEKDAVTEITENAQEASENQTSDSLTQLNAVVNSGEGEEAITLSRETIENVNDSSLSLKNNEEEGKESQVNEEPKEVPNENANNTKEDEPTSMENNIKNDTEDSVKAPEPTNTSLSETTNEVIKEEVEEEEKEEVKKEVEEVKEENVVEKEEEPKENEFTGLTLNSLEEEKEVSNTNTATESNVPSAGIEDSPASLTLDLNLQGDDMKDMVKNLFDNGFW